MVTDLGVRALYVGDEVHCGACNRVIGIGIVPYRVGSRIPCKSCSTWVLLPLRGG